jgi:hypothetical protein
MNSRFYCTGRRPGSTLIGNVIGWQTTAATAPTVLRRRRVPWHRMAIPCCHSPRFMVAGRNVSTTNALSFKLCSDNGESTELTFHSAPFDALFRWLSCCLCGRKSRCVFQFLWHGCQFAGNGPRSKRFVSSFVVLFLFGDTHAQCHRFIRLVCIWYTRRHVPLSLL